MMNKMLDPSQNKNAGVLGVGQVNGLNNNGLMAQQSSIMTGNSLIH